MKRIIFVALVISSLVSCRSTKQIGAAISKRDTVVQVAPGSGQSDTAAFIKGVLGAITRNRISFTTFSAKVNVDYRGGGGKNYDVNATIRMIRDSAIWISANAVLGIEAIRVLVTRDSVKVMNKLEKTYTARSIDYLQEVTELPLGLDILQDLLIGNPVYLDSNVVSYARFDNSISIISLGQWFKNQLTVGEPGKAVQRIKLDDADVSRSRTADLTYDDYESNKGPLFATKRRITVSDKKKLDISLDFKNYDLGGEVSFPFSVPKNFKRN